jgi:hypothetical protein
MSDTIIEEQQEVISLEDLDHHWMSNGLPVFMANRPDICDIVESLGFNLYYLLTNNDKKTTTSTTNPTTKVTTQNVTTAKTMQLFKVVNNFVGRSVSLSNDPFDDLFIQIEEEAEYSLPPIPIVIIDKLDQFFRLVDAQHGTESIVMLTYDTTKTDSEGWGVLVPDQTNTSVHCNYDPHSIATMKPDDVMIVGSVHSHPGMSAYASGTDHADQADFDGIHITFGWQKNVNNGATQYHIELQMSGKAYTLNPEDVFENYFVDKTPDAEVVEWTDKVKKVLPPSLGGANTNTHQVTRTSGTAVTPAGQAPSKERVITGLESVITRFRSSHSLTLEEGAIVVAELSFNAERFVKCPICTSLLDEFNSFNGYCDHCYLPITTKGESLGKIVTSLAYYCQDMFVDSHVPVYLWTIDEDGTESLMKIIETTLHSAIQQEIEASDAENYSGMSSIHVHDESPDTTYCCGIPTDQNGGTCMCSVRVTVDDLLDFDSATKPIDLYSSDSQCTSCEFYYDYQCNRWRSHLLEYVENPVIDLVAMLNSINDEGCTQYTHYHRTPYNDYLYSE